MSMFMYGNGMKKEKFSEYAFKNGNITVKEKLLMIAFFCFVLNANSQTSDSLRHYDLGEVVVTGSRIEKLVENTPEVMHVITSKDIEQLNVSSTGEIIEYLTGVNVESGTGSGYPKRSIVSLNGFPANYSLVMVDGIRLLTEHIHTGQNIDLIPPDNIERIEVIKGAASAQYGSDTMGGVVNIITKKASDKTESSIRLSGGSYGTYNPTISVRTPVNENVSISTFSNYEESAGVPILAPAHRIGNMGYTKFSLMNNINWDIDKDASLNTNIYYTHNSMEFRDEDVYGKMLLSSMDYEHIINNKLLVSGRLKYSHWDSQQSKENNNVFNPEMFIRWNPLKTHAVTAGTELRYNKFSRSAVLERSQQTAGVFLQHELDLENFSLLSALRLDKVENIAPVITPKIAAMYRLNDGLRIRGSLGKGFNAPSVQQLYEKGYGHGGRAYRFGNPDLKPEHSLTSTFSVEYAPVNSLQFLLHGYYNTITNMITPIYKGEWEENPDTSKVIDRWVRTNTHKAEIYGVESSLSYQINDKFKLEGGYNYVYNQNITTGKQLPYFPGESFLSKIIYNYKLSGKLSGLCFISLRATKNRSSWNWKPAAGAEHDDPEGLITELGDYQLVNAGAKFSYNKKFDIYMNVANLLGQNIQKLDDLYTEIKGEPTWKVGLLINLD